MNAPVVDQREESRFEIRTPAGTAVLEYERSGDRLTLIHTEVPAAARKRGIGTRLVEGALLQARQQGLKIDPQCPFVRAYIERHPEVRELLVEGS